MERTRESRGGWARGNGQGRRDLTYLVSFSHCCWTVTTNLQGLPGSPRQKSEMAGTAAFLPEAQEGECPRFFAFSRLSVFPGSWPFLGITTISASHHHFSSDSFCLPLTWIPVFILGPFDISENSYLPSSLWHVRSHVHKLLDSHTEGSRGLDSTFCTLYFWRLPEAGE